MKKSMYILAGVLVVSILAGAVLFGGAAALTTAADSGSDVQTVEAAVAPFAYPQITVEVNKPVRINFKVDEANLNACNNEIIIPEWNIQKKLSAGDNFVEFTPAKTGTYRYSCWMNMIGSSIVVIDEGAGEAGAAEIDPSDNQQPVGCPMLGGGSGYGARYGGCCGARL